MAVVRHRAHSLPTIYKECAVNREAFSIIRKAGRRVFGQVHPLLCDEVDKTFKTNKLTKLDKWDSYTIEWFNNRTARLLVLLGIQAQTARINLPPLVCTSIQDFSYSCQYVMWLTNYQLHSRLPISKPIFSLKDHQRAIRLSEEGKTVLKLQLF